MAGGEKTTNDNDDTTLSSSSSSSTPSSSSSLDWIHNDDACQFLYENQFQKSATTIHCRKRVNLMRICITQAYSVRLLHEKKKKNSKKIDNCDDDRSIPLFLEFGVHKGQDIFRMASHLKVLDEKNNNNKRGRTIFHGFDSFVGLPEDWNNGQVRSDGSDRFQAGSFSTNGKEPSFVENNNNNTNTVVFHKGWFDDTLPQFLDSLLSKDQVVVAFVHFDADVYSSTKTVLNELCRRRPKVLVAGAVLLFDEFWNYPGWQEGEYKAWCEVVEEYHIQYRYFGIHTPSLNNPKKNCHSSRGYQSVAVILEKDIV